MYNPMDISRIDRQIDELQRLKSNYQAMQQPPQPINNIITSQPMTPPQQPIVPIFEAKFTNENPADILIQNKTAFIDLKNGKLSIKEVDGEIKEYELILPKDEKDLRIEELEAKMKKLESSYNALLSQNISMGTNINKTYIDTPINTNIPKIDNKVLENNVAENVLVDNAVKDNLENSIADAKASVPKKGMFNKQK